MQIEEFYRQLAPADLALLQRYLQRRRSEQPAAAAPRFNVVLDILHDCNLNCIGCGTNARRLPTGAAPTCHMTAEKVRVLCEKIRDCARVRGQDVFINIGGGEPFLCTDIQEILAVVSGCFGPQSVGIDTNATLSDSLEQIRKALPCLGYIGISVNGLREYHNRWSGRPEIDPYGRSMGVVQDLCRDPRARDKLEVTSVATRENIRELPLLMEELAAAGVRRYSVHRAIPVGRMARHTELLPNAMEYLDLLLGLIRAEEKTGMRFHLHHSIENIHQALLFGDTTYDTTKAGDRNPQSSIGIGVEGSVVFDAWCMAQPWCRLTCGNIYADDTPLQTMLDDPGTPFSRASRAAVSDKRCGGCPHPCAGGSRVVAAAAALNGSCAGEEELIRAFEGVDPACPLYGRCSDI